MLLILFYHGVNSSRYSNSASMLFDHLQFVQDHFHLVLPTKELLPKNSVCLCFDDGCFDLYHFVFPMLTKLQLKALFAIPAKFIPNTVSSTTKKRLEAVDNFHTYKKYDPSGFCTYSELLEMAKSNFCHFASHSLTHQNMTKISDSRLDEELKLSKNVLMEKFNTPIESFVYPFGAWNQYCHAKVMQEYTYIFRIGHAANFSFTPKNKMLTRICCDRLARFDAPFQFLPLLGSKTKALINHFR